MNEHEANVERVDALGKSLDDAMLDALNRMPPEERALMADKIRDALTDLPRFRIVDSVAARADERAAYRSVLEEIDHVAKQGYPLPDGWAEKVHEVLAKWEPQA